MTGSTQILVSGGPLNVQSPVVTLSDVKTGSTANAFIQFNADGTITIGGSGSTCVPLAWYAPTLAGVGNGYWVKCHVNSGSAPANPDVVQALSSPVAYGIGRSALGTATGNWTVSIYSNAAGTVLAGTPFTFNATATWN